VRSPERPLHLLFLDEPSAHDLVDRRFNECRADPFALHLRIKAFYGTSENAVKTQIWIAVSGYVLVAIVRKQQTHCYSTHPNYWQS
jgi:hypothetical protein